MIPFAARVVPAFLLLAACTMELPPPVIPPARQCGAADLQGLVGQRASVLQTMRFGGPVRITRPGEAVTMDYSESRLNIRINRAERIVSVTCG